MDFSIIINTHNQSKFLNECIKTCLNQNYSSYEIIVVDTSIRPSKDKYKNTKKLKYFHIKEKFKKFPILNQMYQIQYGFFKSKGKYICLLDGDDKFSNLKLNNLSKIFGQTKNKIIQDVPYLFSKTFKKKSKIKLYKNNIFFKKILVSWPQIFGTSTISCSREILDKFFKKGKPFCWNYLAIDIKLILFARTQFDLILLQKRLTMKRIHYANLDKTFSNLISTSFWKRRKMQIEYDFFLKKKNVLNLDYIITKIINVIL